MNYMYSLRSSPALHPYEATISAALHPYEAIINAALHPYEAIINAALHPYVAIRTLGDGPAGWMRRTDSLTSSSVLATSKLRTITTKRFTTPTLARLSASSSLRISHARAPAVE